MRSSDHENRQPAIRAVCGCRAVIGIPKREGWNFSNFTRRGGSTRRMSRRSESSRSGSTRRGSEYFRLPRYLEAASSIGHSVEEGYQRALGGVRATLRGEEPAKPEDPFLLRDATAVLMDCGLRPDECFRLRWEDVRDDAVNVLFGKTASARRTIPLTPRMAAFLEMRRAVAKTEWVFPALTRSGHIEKSSLKKQHAKACKLAEIGAFVLYTFRHTCLTRWAAYMDPYTLAYLAGHSDFSTTRRYVHPQAHTVRDAMERARVAQGGHNSGHSNEKAAGG